jgi:hypothetical protein
MMNISGKIPLLFVTALAWVVFISSCANQGMPTGGPRDSLPPVLLNTQPQYKALNYKSDEVRFTFNEYIITDKISEMLVVSPPLEKRPTILTKSKTLIIKFNEDLQDSTTYSLDFKNSIADNNERNELENMRFSFSTGDVYDSLRVAGRIATGFNMEPAENALVLLHNNLHDSAIYTERPDFIAKTDETGIFMIDNIAPGKYHLFALNDANSDLKYNEGAEEIAFYDSIVVPSAVFEEERDTLIRGVDSLLITGRTHFLPKPVYLRQFTEDLYEQYLDSYSRETRYKCTFVFNETVDDTFNIRLINTNADDWYLLEPNQKVDSINMWITDTVVANIDSLVMEVSYFQLDSAQQLYVHHDTLPMTFTEKKVEESRSRRRGRSAEEEEKGPDPIPQFVWATTVGSVVDLNQELKFTSPEPLKNINTEKFRLYLTDDTLKTPLEYTFLKDTLAWRTYNILYPWEPETNYTFEIDSAAAENIYGITNRELQKKFTTREEDFYGRILVNCSHVSVPTIVQLLDNKEEVLFQKKIDKDQTVIFDYLEPAKYILKVIFDRNNNNQWDPGSYQDKYQPEKVFYWNNIIKVRSNWDNTIPWDLTPDPTYVKKIIDEELEEQKRKEAEEKAKREEENENRQQNNLLQDAGSGGIMRR